jgi:hypothetical protein
MDRRHHFLHSIQWKNIGERDHLFKSGTGAGSFRQNDPSTVVSEKIIHGVLNLHWIYNKTCHFKRKDHYQMKEASKQMPLLF